MTFESLLVDSIYLSTLTTTTNDFGETLETYTDGTTAIACRVNPITNAERLDPSGFFDNVQYKVYMDYAELVVKGDHVTYDSEEYKVKNAITDSSASNKTAFLELLT